MFKFIRCRMPVLMVQNAFGFAGKSFSKRTIGSFVGWKTVPKRRLSPGKFTFSQLFEAQSRNASCWKCDTVVSEGLLFCHSCRVVQKPPNNPNFFQLFGLESVYEVDEILVSKIFRDLQRVLHPDKFSLRSQEELSIAEEYSSLINKAYSTLRNPWTRGVYLLKQLGIDFDEETTVDDPNLLMEVMERNERVAEANDYDQLKSIDLVNKKDINLATKVLSKHFKDKKLDDAKRQLIKLKYYTNIDSKIGEKKLSFGFNE